MTATLSRFTITKALDESFLLMIEDDSGSTLELEASYEQLDLIVEAIEEELESEVDDHDVVDTNEDEVAEE